MFNDGYDISLNHLRKADTAFTPLTSADLVRQGAEAAARCKMFMQGIDRSDLVSYYDVLSSRLDNLADQLE